MFAVHRLQHPVAARLHRQMEKRHELVDLAMRRDQIVVHVGGMAGGIADPRQSSDPVERGDQVVQALPVILPGIDVLAQQRDLLRAGIDQRLCLVDDGGERVDRLLDRQEAAVVDQVLVLVHHVTVAVDHLHALIAAQLRDNRRVHRRHTPYIQTLGGHTGELAGRRRAEIDRVQTNQPTGIT